MKYKVEFELVELTNSEENKESSRELTEFEKSVYQLCNCTRGLDEDSFVIDKASFDKLLSIARKQIASEIDVNTMVGKFKDDFIGEFDSATINKVADDRAKLYRQGIQDTLNKIKGE